MILPLKKGGIIELTSVSGYPWQKLLRMFSPASRTLSFDPAGPNDVMLFGVSLVVKGAVEVCEICKDVEEQGFIPGADAII